MSEEKKTIVRDLGFGGLMHIPPLRVHHQLLRELANNFKLGENRLETGYGSFKITPKTIGDALGINASVNYKKLSEDDKEIFRRFQGKTLKNLTNEMMDIGVGNEQYRLMFKRIFILYKQMAFLLPTTINKISPVHLAPIFEMDTITERNWGGHVLSFIIKGITDYMEKKKKAIDGCLFALMIIYFHLSKNKDKKRAERPLKSWIANWSKEQLGVVKMAKTRGKMKKIEKKEKKQEIKKRKASSTSSLETETTDSDSSTSESETQEDSKDSPRKQPSKKEKKMDSKKRKKGQEDSKSESKSTDETQSKKKKVVVEHSSPEEDQSYHGEKEADLQSTKDVNLESDDPSSQGHTTQSSVNRPADSIMSLVEESASEPANLNMMVVRKETPSETLAIFIYVMVNFMCRAALLNPPPQELEESTLTLPASPSKINPTPEDTAAMMMMARTASYVPKKDPLPSFSLAFTDSSQEETITQEEASTQDEHVEKTPETPTLLEQLENLVHKIASGGVTKEEKSPQIPKESGAESFEKFETPVRPDLDTTDMKQKCYHWAIRVKSYSNERIDEFDDIGRLQAGDIYTLSKFHLALLAPKTHIEAEIVSAMCFIVNQQNIQSICWGVHLKTRDKDKEIEPPYLNISGQKTSYDCAIYVMKWLEILQPTNIKRRKYEWDNWNQDEVDHFRVEYTSRILFHDMNLDKSEAIKGSNAIRLSKPSSLLLSPYCQIDSEDVDID
ncbi:hypothetical protein Ahy_A01g003827 [Arachis hypogaea]|uniref:Ubiquitin-like protease family profile domain-containing protein n=1 Tax=Arachis hypogaea TaxID=3818 RepID=A0A445EUH8_ARAHY|nr:hypothetical protein Ahy_A01g003827 [Arachis hypogaea]